MTLIQETEKIPVEIKTPEENKAAEIKKELYLVGKSGGFAVVLNRKVSEITPSADKPILIYGNLYLYLEEK